MPLKSDVEALYQTKQKALEEGLSSMGIPIAGVSSLMSKNKAMDMTIADLMEQRIKLKHENWLKKQQELKNLAKLMGYERLAEAMGKLGGQFAETYSPWKTAKDKKETDKGLWDFWRTGTGFKNQPENTPQTPSEQDIYNLRRQQYFQLMQEKPEQEWKDIFDELEQFSETPLPWGKEGESSK